ncbi:MAG: alpha/beta hydrolase [Burkholderiales bacterium]
MPRITTQDGVKLHYEEAGSGVPIVFVHEFAGDLRSWEPQLAHFSRRYRCIAYNARGYPPSDVPEGMERYSQELARDDILAVLDGLRLERAFIVGLSMGGFATLHFGIQYSARALGLVVAGCGYGAHPDQRAAFQESSRANARLMLEEGMARFAATYGHGPTRLQLRDKDPRGFARYIQYLTEHSAKGSANTMLGYQARRPSLYDLKKEMAGITAPTLVIAGDEDEATLEPGLLMKRTIPNMGLVVLPRSGHALNLEDPALFNRIVEDFLHQVESGRWA